MISRDNNSLQGAILLAHGSSEPEAAAEILDLCQTLSQAKPNRRFEAAFLNQEPKLDSAVSALISLGCRRIQILPLLVFRGKHVLEDIPKNVEILRVKHPEILFELKPYLSRLPDFKDLILNELDRQSSDDIES